MKQTMRYVLKASTAVRFGLLVFAFLLSSQARAASTPIVLFANYSCPDAEPHINSTVTFYSAMISNGTIVSVSATAWTAGPGGSVTLNSSAFATLGNQTLYVTDGQRAWAVGFFTGNPIQINNSNLIGGGATALAVADYDPEHLKSFTVYSGATLATGGVLPPGSPQMWSVLAGITQPLNDAGTDADTGGSGDGLWRGNLVITDQDRLFQNVQVNVQGVFNGVQSAFKLSENTINIDAQLPHIDSFSFTTNKANYNGILYLSALSQGTSSAQPTSALGTFSATTNKNGCVVTVTVNSTSPKVLPPIAIGDTAGNRTGFQTWKGDDGNGIYVADNAYSYSMGVVDKYGVQGVTITSLVRVVSLRVGVQNIVLSPSQLSTLPNFTDSLITRVDYKVVVDRDNGGDMAPSLRVLGWSNAGVTADLNQVLSPASYPYYARRLNTVLNLSELDFLKADGSVGIAQPSKDAFPNSDTDVNFLYMFRGAPDDVVLASCYTPDGVGTTTNAAAVVWAPDGDTGNDWDYVAPFDNVGNLYSAPTKLEKSLSISFRGATPAQGNYRLRLRAYLTGLDALAVGDPSDAADVRDYCTAATNPPVFRSSKIHFAPSARPEGITSGEGFGIFAEDTTATFVMNQSLPPTGDTSPPFLVSSNPAAAATVRGADFDILHPLSVVLGEDQSAISSDNNVTRIVLKDPSGNAILGSSRTDGGTVGNQMTVYFYPLQALSSAGTYTMQINACSVNCMGTTNVSFTVLDEATPSVLQVDLTSLSAGIKTLSPGTSSYQGPFSYVNDISVRLGMGSGTSNSVDWQNSTVTLYELTSGVPVAYADLTRVSPLTSTATAPSDSRLLYHLGQPINRSGQFEIRIKTVSKNGSGDTFTGPDSSFIMPRFGTQLDSNVLGIDHQGTLLSGFVAPLPITISSNSTNIAPNTATISIVPPDYASYGNPAGRLALSGTASGGSGWQMMASGIGRVAAKLRYEYNASLPPSIILHYDDTDIPTGVSESALAVYGYDGSWQLLTANSSSQSGTTGNTFTINPPVSTDTYFAYGIFYPTANVATLPTATPVVFRNTRSFSPNNSNPIYRKARFYYSDKAPKDVDARIYDTSGTLIKAMSLGNGISLADVSTDASYGVNSYYFEWDGRNDNGTLVRNGIYLARWRLTRSDGSTETQVKPVALIK